MEQHSQNNWAAPISRFLEFVETQCEFEIRDPGDPDTSTLRVTRPFMPLDRIQAYFQELNYLRLRAILSELFPNKYVNPKDIVPKYTAVFSTLLCAQKGHYILHFTQYNNLSDTHLPFDPDSPPAHLPQTGDSNFLQDFCQRQWKFCAANLEDLSKKHFERDRVLPIIFKEKLGGGGTAILWLIKVYPYYNGLLTEDCKIRLGQEAANTFVLKEYSTADAEIYYDNETAAFNTIGSNSHIISYYGSFTKNGTFNVVLEHADKGTLKDFFEKQLAPTSGPKIIKFWQGLFNLLDALRSIHSVEPFASGPQIFQGWHQDVKPENVLVVGNGAKQPEDWEFKLADLGISHFKIKSNSREDSTASENYGTKTYGAPECSRPDARTKSFKLRVKQNIDIWSLGCIYSETVRWLAHQRIGIHDYREERKAEIREIPAVGCVDCFHNGEDALEAVRRSHEKAAEDLHKRDYITDKVIDMIDDMLISTDDRPTAHDLWRKQLRIVEAARKRLRDSERDISSKRPGLNLNERAPPRKGQTYPAAGPSPTAPLPPSIPPEFVGNFVKSAQDATHPTKTSHRSSWVDSNDVVTDEPNKITDAGVAYMESPPGQEQTPPNTSHHTSPITPPSTQSPYFPTISLPQDRDASERPEEGQLGGPLRYPAGHGQPRETRGASQYSESPSVRRKRSSTGIAPSVAGSLGRNHRNHDSRNTLGTNNANLDYARPASTSYEPQLEASFSGLHIQQRPEVNNDYRTPTGPSYGHGQMRETRGANQITQSHSLRPSTPSAGTMQSVTGSLGHSQRNSDRFGSLRAENENPSDFRPASTSYDSQIAHSISDLNLGGDSNNNHSHREESITPPILIASSPTYPAAQYAAPQQPRTAKQIAASDLMTVEEALHWRQKCKSARAQVTGLNKTLQARLENRDHVFLIDDSVSMAKHWEEVVRVFEALSYIVKSTDKDGLDLFFTISKSSNKGVSETSRLTQVVEAQKRISGAAKTDINIRLTQILERYTDNLERKRLLSLRGSKPKPLSLYIFTNGIWEKEVNAEKPIVNAVKKLTDLRKDRLQIGIQFISFGNDPKGLVRLEHLDKGLDVPTDIVDTVPSNGNVWKMLLGSINASFDDDNRTSPMNPPTLGAAGPSNFTAFWR